jgi:hypothetical protein
MNPRKCRWLLCVAVLVLFLMGLSPMHGGASVLPCERGGGSGPVGVVEPPMHGGGGGTRDGGDPDEVVIFIATPANPVVVTETVKPAPETYRNLRTVLAEIRALLFWAGVTR